MAEKKKKKFYSALYLRQRARGMLNHPKIVLGPYDDDGNPRPMLSPATKRQPVRQVAPARDDDDADYAGPTRETEKLYSEAEAATFLKVSVRQLADRRRAGRIECFKDGHFIGYSEMHLSNYLSDTQRDTGFDPKHAEQFLRRLRQQMRGPLKPKKRAKPAKS